MFPRRKICDGAAAEPNLIKLYAGRRRSGNPKGGRRAHNAVLNHLRAWAASQATNLDTLTRRQLGAWIATLAASEDPPFSLAFAVSVLREFYSFLLARGVITENPAVNFSTQVESVRFAEFQTDDVRERACQLVPVGTERGIRDRVLLELYHHAGLRAVEIVSLRVSDVDLPRGELSYGAGQHGTKRRTVALSESTCEWLSEHLYLRSQTVPHGVQHLFLDKAERPMTGDAVSCVIKRYTAKAAQTTGEIAPNSRLAESLEQPFGQARAA